MPTSRQNRLPYSPNILATHPNHSEVDSPTNVISPSATLGDHIESVVREYFDNLKEQQPTQLYDLMLTQFEKPLINVVLEYTRGNQTRTAEILGLNRGTLRKKLKTHQLL